MKNITIKDLLKQDESFSDSSFFEGDFPGASLVSEVDTVEPGDRGRLNQSADIKRPVPSQIIESPQEGVEAELKTNTQEQQFNEVLEGYETIIKKAEFYEKIIDNRVKDIEYDCATGNSQTDAALLNAMRRLFGKDSTKITYKEYKRVLELRQILAEEDRDTEIFNGFSPIS